MSGTPVQIVEILKDERTQKPHYELKSDALSKILSNIEDIKVSVISIVGKSRRGKSFLLSYLIKYLSDSLNVNWIFNGDQNLEGFEWKNTVDPVTKGIWIWSKPFIFTNSVGEEIAILLMDSQGVFDENTDSRDWSTIVGITLLTSSIFIFNVFTDIQENNLTELESFLTYGQMAMGHDQTDDRPFQKLLFLIRDWNHSQEINYGLSGGRKYIKDKLSIKSTHSKKSIRVRELINECFEDVDCFLMPKHIEKEEGFTGSVSQLNPKFIDKMKELFSLFFNPESLDVKVISGYPITGRNLLKYFEGYIEIFNSDKLDPINLLEVTAKATDYKIIFDLKMKYVLDMRKEINSKDFLSITKLIEIDHQIKEIINQLFNTQIKSKNDDLVQHLRQIINGELKSEYLKLYTENEKRRKDTAQKTINMCINLHKDWIENFFTDKIFEKAVDFDKVLAEAKNQATNKFNEVFNEENSDSNAHYLLKILKTIGENEILFKAENQKRYSESKMHNKEIVEKSLSFYSERIKATIDENIFLIDENFVECETNTKTQSLNMFSDDCTGNVVHVQKFKNSLNSKLEHRKTELYNYNKDQMKKTITETELNMKHALNYYIENMKKTLNLLRGNEDFNEINHQLKEKSLEIFEKNKLLKHLNLWSQYINKINSDIDKAFIDFNKSFNKKVRNLEQFYNQAIDDAMKKYFLDENAFFNKECLLSAEEAITLRNSLLNNVKQHFENISKEGKFEEIKNYTNCETAKASDSILINKLIGIFSEKMQNELKLITTFFTRQNLSKICDERKTDIIDSFNANKKTENSNELYSKLNEEFEKAYGELYEENEQQRETCVEKEIEKSFSVYKQHMTEILNQVCLEPNRFKDITVESKEKAHEMLNQICGQENELKESYFSKLKQLIETEEKKFEINNSNQFEKAKQMNSESVKKCLDFYESSMESVLSDNLIYTEEDFRKYYNQIKDETFNQFAKHQKCGEKEFIEKFEFNLQQKTSLLKRKYRKVFSDHNNCIVYYKDLMSKQLDFIEKEVLEMKHQEFKSETINLFKSNFTINDEEFINKQIDKLENKIDKEFKENFLSLYLREINTNVESDETQSINSSIIHEQNIRIENEIIDTSNESEDEYDSIDSGSEKSESLRDESDETEDTKLKQEIETLIKEYEDRMSLMIEIIVSEDDFIKNHDAIKSDIETKFYSLNPFSSSIEFEPFLKQLNEEIDKSFEDCCIIFKVKLDKIALVLKDPTRNAIKFYREEMDKYFENTNYLSKEKLEKFSSSVIERTIDKFQNEKEDIPLEFFEKNLKEHLNDVFIEISEENLKYTPTLPAIGIDLGTTYSCVAYFRARRPKGEVVVIPNDFGNRTTPSVVNFMTNNEVVGEAANEGSYSNSSNFVYSAKRLIGRQFNDEKVQNFMKFWRFKVVDDGNDTAKIKIEANDKTYYPEEISAMVLKNLKQIAEKNLGCPVKNAVITVPAYFNDSQKEATKDAGKLAGLNVLKIINEPTAAALAFQLNRIDNLETKKVLIFDFGGGTLDIVVLVIERGAIVIKAVGGDNYLGGDDIDNNLAQYCLDEFKLRTNITIDEKSEDYEKALRRLTIECERKKRSLCGSNSVVINVENFYKSKDLSIELTRQKFDELNNDIFVKSMNLVEQVIQDSKLDHKEIDEIVLVGGTTRIPKIQKMLSDLFFGKRLNHSLNPDEAVAIGAAIQAAILNGSLAHDNKFLRVSDVAPMSLGVQVREGFMSVVVHRNSRIPEKYIKQYETTFDNQREVEVKIYEGEETMAKDNKLLGTFVIHDIPPGFAGEQQIEITFDINDEGILHVKAKLMNSDEEHGITITEHKGRLTDEELAQLMNNQTD